jgi:hypothetical protein
MIYLQRHGLQYIIEIHIFNYLQTNRVVGDTVNLDDGLVKYLERNLIKIFLDASNLFDYFRYECQLIGKQV